MKKIALALICVFVTGSAAAQTYACQFIMDAGMIKESDRWQVTSFKISEPFFLTIVDGLIDKKPLANKPTDMTLDAVCMRDSFDSKAIGRSHWCADNMSYLSFSEKTLNGGFARTFGAMQSSSSPADSVSISRFKCQQVR